MNVNTFHNKFCLLIKRHILASVLNPLKKIVGARLIMGLFKPIKLEAKSIRSKSPKLTHCYARALQNQKKNEKKELMQKKKKIRYFMYRVLCYRASLTLTDTIQSILQPKESLHKAIVPRDILVVATNVALFPFQSSSPFSLVFFHTKYLSKLNGITCLN